jgi:hypothetical protein
MSRFVNTLVASWLMLPLLLTGAVGWHSHAPHVGSRSADHACRPHVHVAGLGRAEHDDCAEHVHLDPCDHSVDDEGVCPDDHLPPAPDREHDDDAVYLTGEPLAAPPARWHLPELSDGWCLSLREWGTAANGAICVESAGTGPPLRRCAHFALLPHLLRV